MYRKHSYQIASSGMRHQQMACDAIRTYVVRRWHTGFEEMAHALRGCVQQL